MKQEEVDFSLTGLIGDTPLIRLDGLEKELKGKVRLFGKADFLNPGGSSKDRAALYMIQEAEERGLLGEGSVIIEPTSGNTGIALAYIGKHKGYRVILTMPSSMSIERRELLKAYGAELVLTEPEKGMEGAIIEALRLKEEIKNSYMPNQFENMANVRAHYETTGPEIYKALRGEVNGFIAGIGTGGTISGTGKFLKEMNRRIEIIGIEPFNSQAILKGEKGPHKLQGIGAGFIPPILNKDVIDRIVPVKDEEGFSGTRLLLEKESLLCGISSGASVFAALKVLGDRKYEGGTFVIFLHDRGERYLSSEVFKEG